MKESEPAVVADPLVHELLEKVEVHPDERFTGQYPKHWGCHMKVTMQDGMCFEAEVEDPSGSVARPLSREQAMKKAEEFLAVTCPGKEQETIEALLNLDGEEKLPVISGENTR